MRKSCCAAAVPAPTSLLSLTADTLWVADEVASTPVLIPRTPTDEASLHEAIAGMQQRGRAFFADPILDPIPFGFTASIVRLHALRQRFPDVPIMMGIGNLTELVEADTSGINALLLGIAAELNVSAVLTTQVSAHARRAVREADWARRIMHAAASERRLPKGLSDALMTVHAKHPFPDSVDEITTTAAQVRDPSFRVQVSAEGLHVTTATVCAQGRARSNSGRSCTWKATPRTPSTWASNSRTPSLRGGWASATCRTSRSNGAARSSARPTTCRHGAHPARR